MYFAYLYFVHLLICVSARHLCLPSDQSLVWRDCQVGSEGEEGESLGLERVTMPIPDLYQISYSFKNALQFYGTTGVVGIFICIYGQPCGLGIPANKTEWDYRRTLWNSKISTQSNHPSIQPMHLLEKTWEFVPTQGGGDLILSFL